MGSGYGFVIQEHFKPGGTQGIAGQPKEVISMPEKGQLAETGRMKREEKDP